VGAEPVEVEVYAHEFEAYCKGLRRPNFSIAALDQYAREKAIAHRREPAAPAREAAGA
jgi:hypothetical protein